MPEKLPSHKSSGSAWAISYTTAKGARALVCVASCRPTDTMRGPRLYSTREAARKAKLAGTLNHQPAEKRRFRVVRVAYAFTWSGGK